DEDTSQLELPWVTVVTRMQLNDVGAERRGERRQAGALPVGHRHHDPCGFELSASALRDELCPPSIESLHPHTALHRQTKARCIRLEIIRHLVLGRKRIAWRGKGHSNQAIEFGGSEQS